jgi:serine/threonine-protein kinase
MDVRTWTTLSRLLDEALDMEPAAREAWLAGLAAEYAAFRPRLRAMIDQLSAPGTPDILSTLPKFDLAGSDEPGAEDAAEPGPDAIVGAYRLIRKLAAGGQGTVWLAERADGLINRPVALKLPHAFAYRPGLAERLARERDILAALNHPNIARLYDAGVTATGLPFLALEYVEGTPIDAYCADRRLDVRARVVLFLQIVRAVAFAHGQLVIHRDLKPSNVLVTADGQVRLLDFGIARMLDEGTAADSTVTAMAGRAMTLAYASPEQIARGPLGVATDVYSLGVMLFELLAGVRPCTPARDTPAALEEAILTTEPRRPSEVCVAAEFRKALRGDLDSIVLETLHKAPERRYQTAAAFADDLERYLDGRPVRARPDSGWYRTRSFIKRNRLAVAAGAAVLTAIVAGAGVAVWQAGIARAEQRRAEEVKTFIVSLLQDANLDGADNTPQASVRDLLKRAETRLDALPSGPVKTELLIVLGEGLNGLGDTDALEGVATRAVAEAEAGGDVLLLYRARILMAWAHMYRGRPEAALTEIDTISSVLERDAERYARELADVWRLRAHQAIEAGRYDEAVSAAERAVALSERASGAEATPTLNALMTLTEARTQADDQAGALSTAERALRVAERIYGENGAHPYAISTRAKYANALGDTGSLGQAAAQLERVVSDASQVFGPDGRTVAFYLQRLANFQARLGRLDAARASIGRGLAIIERHVEAGSPTLASFRNTAGHIELLDGRGDRALTHFTPTLDSATRSFGADHDNTLTARASRAFALELAGRHDEAAREMAATIAAMESRVRELVRPLYTAGAIARRQGRAGIAEAYLDRAARVVGGDTLLRWQILFEQGRLHADAGRLAEAQACFDKAAAIVRETGVEDFEGTAALAEARRRLGAR